MTTRAAAASIFLALVASSCSGSGQTEISFTEEQLRQIEDLALQEAMAGVDAGDIEVPARPTVTIAPPDTRPLDDPPTAEELDIELDATGRPYDVEQGWYDGTTLVTEPIGTLHIADGELRVLDGSMLEVDPVGLLDGEFVPVAFDVERLDVTMLFAGLPPTDDQTDTDRPARRAAVGVRLDVPDAAPVATWQPYEFAYGTDGGVGGLTSGEIVDGAADQLPYSEGGDFFAEWDYAAEYYLGTHASTEGPDVFIWPNGFGDGGYPMSKGLDADGRLVSLVLPTLTYPWRLMITDGTPPADVTEREDQYLECLAGTRPVSVGGTCLGDDGF